jgi:hypothetical protein
MDSETEHGYLVLADISGNTCRMEQHLGGQRMRQLQRYAPASARSPTPTSHPTATATMGRDGRGGLGSSSGRGPAKRPAPMVCSKFWGADASARAVTSASVMKDADEDIARAAAASGAVDHRWARRESGPVTRSTHGRSAQTQRAAIHQRYCLDMMTLRCSAARIRWL